VGNETAFQKNNPASLATRPASAGILIKKRPLSMTVAGTGIWDFISPHISDGCKFSELYAA
jgi:hypothetical protein